MITTKVGARMVSHSHGSDLGRKHVVWCIRERFERSQLDYIDLYYAHAHDPGIPARKPIPVFPDFIRWIYNSSSLKIS
ncbi:MAG: aldo/keto reductase [Sulfolobales archaeon]